MDELTYLLESGSDRIGALDFQRSPTEYVPRATQNVRLEELIESAERVEKGIPLTPPNRQWLVTSRHGFGTDHAAFWDGKTLVLTPAYDICPQARTGNEASQAMLIAGSNNLSQLRTCLASAHNFLLSSEETSDIVGSLTSAIEQNWESVCDEAQLTQVDRKLLWRRQFLNPFSMER